MPCLRCGRENAPDAVFCNLCGVQLDSPLPASTGLSNPPGSTEGLVQSQSGAGRPKDSAGEGDRGFVGRLRETGELGNALENVISDHGQLLMLVGEPGIGKTRTAQEMTARAENLGMLVLWGRCYEGEGAPPYWPWVQPLRSYIQSTDSNRLASTMGSGAADIADIVSDLHQVFPDLAAPPELEPEQARFRLFNSVATFLKTASQTQPLMIVLDDLHWADRSSLLLLEFVAQEIRACPLLILGTYRDAEVSRHHPLSQTLGNLVREDMFARINLSGLSSLEVEELIRLTSGDNPPSSLVDVVYDRTEGNPLFVNEVVRVLRQDGITENQSLSISIPEGIRETIGRRLSRLSPNCHQILATASIIGREFDFNLLYALSAETTEDQLLQVIDEGLETHLIEDIPGIRDRYQFTHALIQETLAGELSTSRRIRMHARVGQTLEEVYSANLAVHAAELAHHFSQAEGVTGSQKMVHYCLMAGEQALAAYAHEEALQNFQRALEAKEGQPMDVETALILSGLGRAQAATFERHRMREVMSTLGRALDYFAQQGDVNRALAIAEYPFYPLLGQSTGNAALIASALALVSPESPAAGRLLSRYGRVMGTEEGDYATAQQAFDQALSIARREGNSTLEMQTLADSANVDMLYARHRESLDKSLGAIELARLVDDPQAEALARYSSVLDNIALGDLESVRLQASEILANAERLGDRFWMTLALRSHEDAAHLVGDWDSARNYSDRGLALSPLECRNLCTRTMVEYQTGNIAAGDSILRQLVAVTRQTRPGATLEHALTAMVIPLVARISGDGSMLGVAENAIQTVLASTPRIAYMDWDVRLASAFLAVHRNDSALAREQYHMLKPFQGTMMLFVMVSTDRALGLLAQTMGDLDQALAHFENALVFCRQAGYQPELGWVCCDYADALSQRDASGDAEKARSMLVESLSISVTLGMRPLMERCQGRLDSLALPTSSAAPAYPDGLSQREVEVLSLIAAGQSNREIAERLFISLNTVANHVRNILTKTATNNRTEAAAYATRHNLLDE